MNELVTIPKAEYLRLKAIEEGGKAREYFRTLGFSVAELNDASISNIDIISRMGQAHKDSGSSAQTQAAMIAILGEKAFKAAGAMAKLKEMGPIDLVSQEQIDQVGKLADRMDEIQRRGTVAVTPLVTYLGDQLESDFKLIVKIQEVYRNIFQESRENNELYRTGFGGALRPSIAEGLGASTMPRGTIGTIDSKVKRETSMFSEAAAPGWVNTLVGQIKIQTNETRAVRVNTGRTAQAVE